ncbi:MAG: hypothetical protein IJL20_12550 [Lachnospiraceae bacterium]|nr:hypothetical protein [Lachnospiraceae bacterium]
MKKIMSIFIVMALVIGIIPYNTTKAKTKYDREMISGYVTANYSAQDEKIMKALKKNAWSSRANEDSTIVSRSYAMYKIYKALKDLGIVDGTNYDWDEEGFKPISLRAAGYTKILGPTKTQRKAVKWMLTNSAYYYTNIERGIRKPEPFDGYQQLTRAELVNMIGSAIMRIYPQNLKDYALSTTWESSPDFYGFDADETAFYKGVIVGTEIELDDYATKEDLSRALKNFKIVAKYAIRPVYKDTPKAYTKEECLAEVAELQSWLEERYGAKMEMMYGTDEIYRIEGHGMRNSSRVEFDLADYDGGASKCWMITLNFTLSLSNGQRYVFRGTKISFIDTIKKIITVNLG